MDVENITPYGGDSDDKAGQVRRMFDSIAPAYDFMNRAMSLGMDRSWKRRAVDLLAPAERYPRVLDVATGTADIAIQLVRQAGTPSVTGIDLSEGMLAIGREKAKGMNIELIRADCLALPFGDGSFDAAICAYGVRNFADIPAGLRELHRVVRPGGRLVVLELSTPRSPLVRPFYNLYTRVLIPAAGRIISCDTRAYSYLPESIAAVPQGEAMCSLLRQAGFATARAESLFMGVCSIYVADKGA